MRLLIVTDSFLPRWDGVSRFLDGLIPACSRAFELSIVAPKYKGIPPEYPQAKIYYMHTHKFSIGDYQPPKRDSSALKKAINEADLVFTQTIGPLGGYAIRYARRTRKRVIAFTHSVEWELVPNHIVRTEWIKKGVYHLTRHYAKKCYNRCDHLIMPSEEVQHKLSLIGITTPGSVIHLGTDTKVFSPAQSKRRAKENIGIDPEKFVIGYSGRISREKDLTTLKEAFLLLRERYKHVVLVIIGEGSTQEEKNLEGEGIERFGRSDNVSKFLQAMDVYVLPSLTETSSLSTMEAMSTGITVIATKVGHVQHYIEDGVNGFFIKKKDPRMLAARLEYLLHNTKRIRDIGRAARKTIQKQYAWTSSQKKILTLLKNQGKEIQHVV